MYFWALVAEGELQSRLTSLKHIARDEFQSQRALRSPAHITLIPPVRLTDQACQQIERRIASVALQAAPFILQIDGVKGFSSRVIYADVVEHQELVDLQHRLDAAFREECPGHRIKHHSYRPHVTLAFRDLDPKIYPLALAYFQNLGLHFEWPCRHISRLKHHQDHWEIDHQVLLGPPGLEGA
ncbi:MAG: 2'-5' RNA ligase family protein [Saprospiraceae bacterium]|nr:2'-5' RNA ligase family protein [Saprospiraceae bacterium]